MKPLILQKFIASFDAKPVIRNPVPQRKAATNRICSLAVTSLTLLLGATGYWLAEQTIVPLAAHAYTSRLSVTLTAEPGESFETLLRRAESVARAAAQRSFDRDILITDVAIVINAEYQSRISPVLTLEATRNQWKSRPDTRRWATYYRNAKTLLGLGNSSATAATTANPVVTTQTAPVFPDRSQPGANQSPNSPSQPVSGTTTSPNSSPSSNTPGKTQILPDRIPTPGGIGK